MELENSVEEDSTTSSASKKRKRPPRLSMFEVSEIAVSKGIQAYTDLLALAPRQKREGKIDLAEFIVNWGRKTVEEPGNQDRLGDEEIGRNFDEWTSVSHGDSSRSFGRKLHRELQWPLVAYRTWYSATKLHRAGWFLFSHTWIIAERESKFHKAKKLFAYFTPLVDKTCTDSKWFYIWTVLSFICQHTPLLWNFLNNFCPDFVFAQRYYLVLYLRWRVFCFGLCKFQMLR